MTVRDAYIHVQQGLQNIAAFVNKNIEPDELDYIWNQMFYKFIDLSFLPEEKRRLPQYQLFQEIQASVDDLRNLQESDYTNTLTLFSNGKKLLLPLNDYHHLINDRTLTSKVCKDKCGVETKQTLIGTNRLTKAEELHNKLNNTLAKTTPENPISKLDGDFLFVYNTYKGKKVFDIDAIYIDYIKTPEFTKYNDTGFPLGTKVYEIPDQTCYKLVRMCIIYISTVTQQNPQKISNLVNTTT